MLLYLDQLNSRAPANVRSTAEFRRPGVAPRLNRDQVFGVARGLNENYARELLELHTVGVGHFTEADLLAVARALSGWTMPLEGSLGHSQRLQATSDQARAEGTVLIGDFLFEARDHDAEAKTILGRPFPAGGGVEEGEEVIRFLARHPDTAEHLAGKFARWFVCDQPSETLVHDLAAVFRETRGDTREVLRAIAHHPEFWAAKERKLKSPLELAVSAVRALGAEFTSGRDLAEWIGRMGEPLYRAASPEGFPDSADAWMGAGLLVQRLNFAVALSNDAIEGVTVGDLSWLEADGSSRSYAAVAALLPGRDASAWLDPIRESSSESIVPLVLGSPAFQYQ